jgi:hypothetical protein
MDMDFEIVGVQDSGNQQQHTVQPYKGEGGFEIKRENLPAGSPLRPEESYLIESVEDAESEESKLLRYPLQAVKAAKWLNPYTAGAEMVKLGTHVAENIDAMKHGYTLPSLIKKATGNWDEEKEKKKVEENKHWLSERLPAVSNVENYLEREHGVPFSPKTTGQHVLSIASDLKAGGASLKAITAGEGVYGALKGAGFDDNDSSTWGMVIGLLMDIFGKGKGGVPKQPSKGTETVEGGGPGGPGGPGAEEQPIVAEYPEKVIPERRYSVKNTQDKTSFDIAENLAKREEEVFEKKNPKFQPVNVNVRPEPQVQKGGEKEISATIEQPSIAEKTAREANRRLEIEQIDRAPEEVRTRVQGELNENGMRETERTSETPQVKLLGDTTVNAEIVAGKKSAEKASKVYKDVERKTFETSKKLYNEAEAAVGDNIVSVPKQAIDNLTKIHYEHLNSSDPLMRDISKEAGKFLNEIDDFGINNVPLKHVFKRIQELMGRAQYEFANAPSNAYALLHKELESILDAAKGLSKEAVELTKNAKNFYKEEYSKFKDKAAKAYLSKKNQNYSSLYNEMSSIDGYNHLNRTIGGNSEMTDIMLGLRRKLIEDSIARTIKQNGVKGIISESQLENALDGAGVDITPAEKTQYQNRRAQLENEHALRQRESQESAALQKSKTAQKEAKAKNKREVAERNLKEKVEKRKEAGKEVEKKREQLKGRKIEEIERKIKTISGVREAKKFYSENPEYAAEWEKEKLSLVKDRLFNSKVGAENAEKTFNSVLEDINDRQYLVELIGKDGVEELLDISKNLKKFESRSAQYKEYIKQYDKDIKNIDKEVKTKNNEQLKRAKEAKKAEAERKKQADDDFIEVAHAFKHPVQALKNAAVDNLLRELIKRNSGSAQETISKTARFLKPSGQKRILTTD